MYVDFFIILFSIFGTQIPFVFLVYISGLESESV